MPEKLSNALSNKKTNLLNISSGSLNLSFRSSISNRSVNKYESNAFLKALGLDLTALTPENIKLDVNKAVEFIKKWKVSSKDEIKKIIRYKVVNEIMNVEERRSVQKLAKINERIKKYMDDKKEEERRKEEEERLLKERENKKKGVPQLLQQKTSLNKKASQQSSKNLRDDVSSVKAYSVSEKSTISKAKSFIVPFDKPRKQKEKIRLNSYRHVDKICRIINNSEGLKTNDDLVRHFGNIKYLKKFDNLRDGLLNVESIGIQQNYIDNNQYLIPTKSDIY